MDNDEEFDLEEDIEETPSSQSGMDNLMNFIKENKKLVIIVGIVLFFILIMLMTSGGSSNNTDNYKISDSTKVITTATGTQLSLLSSDGKAITGVTWESSDITIATVDESGIVKGIKNGTVTITGTYNGNKYTCEVTVSEGDASIKVDSLKFPEGVILMPVGSTYEIMVDVTPGDAKLKNKLFASSNTDIATVDLTTGLITAKAVGQAKIRASVNDAEKLATISIRVVNAQITPGVYVMPESITLTEKEVTLVEGETKSLTYQQVPEKASSDYVIWVSGNDDIASVVNGELVAKKAGSVEVAVTSLGVKDIMVVHVKAGTVPVTDVNLASETVINMNVGERKQIIANVLPTNATNQVLTYGADNPTVVSVDSDGNIDAISPGTTTIYVRSSSQVDINKTISVTVNQPVTPVEPTPVEPSDPGGSYTPPAEQIVVGTINAISSPANAVQSTASGANNNKVTSATLDFETSGNVGEVRYCYYKYLSSACEPDKIYVDTISFTGNGTYVITAIPYYKGEKGTRITRYITIDNGSSTPVTPTDPTGPDPIPIDPVPVDPTPVDPTPTKYSCYCNTSGYCDWRTSGNGYTIDSELSSTECSYYKNQGYNACFIDKTGKYVWGRYLGDLSNYGYYSGVHDSNTCNSKNPTTPKEDQVYDIGITSTPDYGLQPSETLAKNHPITGTLNVHINVNNNDRVEYCFYKKGDSCFSWNYIYNGFTNTDFKISGQEGYVYEVKFKAKTGNKVGNEITKYVYFKESTPVVPTPPVVKTDPVCPTINSYSGLYDGANHSISVSGGSGGTIQYKKGASGTWTTVLPQSNTVGSTTIYVKIVGDSTHNDKDCGSATITIKQEEGCFCQSNGLCATTSSPTLTKINGVTKEQCQRYIGKKDQYSGEQTGCFIRKSDGSFQWGAYMGKPSEYTYVYEDSRNKKYCASRFTSLNIFKGASNYGGIVNYNGYPFLAFSSITANVKINGLMLCYYDTSNTSSNPNKNEIINKCGSASYLPLTDLTGSFKSLKFNGYSDIYVTYKLKTTKWAYINLNGSGPGKTISKYGFEFAYLSDNGNNSKAHPDKSIIFVIAPITGSSLNVLPTYYSVYRINPWDNRVGANNTPGRYMHWEVKDITSLSVISLIQIAINKADI